jgi:hypothetical protein
MSFTCTEPWALQAEDAASGLRRNGKAFAGSAAGVADSAAAARIASISVSYAVRGR